MDVGESKYIIVSAYGPGFERKKNERDSFWYNLGDLVRCFESDEVVCLLGDLNARVGDVKVPDVIEDYSVAGINGSGGTDVCHVCAV